MRLLRVREVEQCGVLDVEIVSRKRRLKINRNGGDESRELN